MAARWRGCCSLHDEQTRRTGAVGRYAPSPTGRLHLGNLSTAIEAHDDIRSRGGVFVLRMEDTDFPRNAPGAEQGIIDDLRWIGLTWDEGPDCGGPAGAYRQSERTELYEFTLRHLAAEGLIYPCRCSRKDIQSSASAPHGPDGLIYPGTCRQEMSSADIDNVLTNLFAAPAGHREVCIRFRSDRAGLVEYHDEIYGDQQCRLSEEFGDFVVLRRDGLWAYQFVCAVDDALMGVTRVVRGSDLLSSTARQVALINALGYQAPVYRHVPLLLDDAGARMSKRDGSQSLASLRERGCGPVEAREIIRHAKKILK